ncbi:hypothetical protein CV103_02635 [Sphingomonas fennica]|nr:hypothetical protein [Sphingomonas sp. MM-1]AGH49053.1 hypothetical protein G432_06640 [Sphingomonas sp. MM-1]MDX3885282.1 hypothetical protein [Sphingomonas sp.]PTD26955.1 hypothetical protein CV103_02635 [Sphingomonas fennica]
MMVTQIGPEATSLCAAVAMEIRGVRTLIEQLAETLVADERFAMDYMDQLQVFDLVIQCADESADLLDRVAQGEGVRPAIERVRLTAVQERLRAAIG